MQTFTLANAVTTAAAQTAVNIYDNLGVDEARDTITVQFDVSGGSARSVQVEGSINGGSTWAILGTAVTATGTTIQTVPRVGMLRANITSVTGSTISVVAAV